MEDFKRNWSFLNDFKRTLEYVASCIVQEVKNWHKLWVQSKFETNDSNSLLVRNINRRLNYSKLIKRASVSIIYEKEKS